MWMCNEEVESTATKSVTAVAPSVPSSSSSKNKNKNRRIANYSAPLTPTSQVSKETIDPTMDDSMTDDVDQNVSPNCATTLYKAADINNPRKLKPLKTLRVDPLLKDRRSLDSSMNSHNSLLPDEWRSLTDESSDVFDDDEYNFRRRSAPLPYMSSTPTKQNKTDIPVPAEYKKALDEAKDKTKDAQSLNERLICELQTAYFYNSVQDQRISELEGHLSSARMEHNEKIQAKSRKHKTALKKVTAEKADYEKRTNTSIAQMNTQMHRLQSTAIGRIEDLENELLSARRSNEELQVEVHRLKAAPLEASLEASLQAQPSCFLCNPTSSVDGTDGTGSEEEETETEEPTVTTVTTAHSYFQAEDEDPSNFLSDPSSIPDGSEDGTGSEEVSKPSSAWLI